MASQRQNNVVHLDENVLIPTTGGLRLACKLWTVKGRAAIDHSMRLICYPGWLDNSGSFDIPAELLCKDYGFAVLAVDPPGCGLSDHRPQSSLYNDFEEAPMVADIADELGWDVFGLVAHSRGAGVCALAAGLLGNRVKVFVCIDSHFALSGMWFEDLRIKGPLAVRKMEQARNMAKKNMTREARVFATFQDAVDANMNNPWFKKSEATARNIVKRHLRPHKDGYTFTHDVRTYGQNQYLHLSDQPLIDFLVSITAPVLQMLDGARWNRISKIDESALKIMSGRSKYIKSGLTVVQMDDKGHHFHSDAAREFCDIAGPWMIQNWNKSSTSVKLGPEGAAVSSRL